MRLQGFQAVLSLTNTDTFLLLRDSISHAGGFLLKQNWKSNIGSNASTLLNRTPYDAQLLTLQLMEMRDFHISQYF